MHLVSIYFVCVDDLFVALMISYAPFLSGSSLVSFSFIFVFSNNITIFTTNKCEKMSIQYTVLGFKTMTFGT